MYKETISDREGICLVILFIAGSSLALPTAPEAGSDLWLAIFCAMIISFPILIVYARLINYSEGNDVFDLLEYAFGKIIGKVIGLLFIWFAFHLGILIIRDFGEFPVTVSLPETPMGAFMLMLMLLAIWIVKEGIEVLARWARIFVIINGPIPTIMILLLIPVMDFDNILPILYEGINPFLKGTFSAFSFPFAETVVFIMILSSLKSKKSSYNIYIKGVLLGGILITGVSLAEVLVLGPDLYGATFFPNHAVAGKVDIGETLQRMEVIVILATITSAFLKISVCLLAVCKGIQKVFKLKDYRFFVMPIGLLMFNFSLFIHNNVNELYEWISTTWSYYSFPFQVIFPILLLIVVYMKKNKSAI